MASALTPFSLMGWIEEHRDQFPKPVGNKVIWQDTEFIAFVSGANSRNDFHINPGDEIFFQLEGDIRVDLQIDGERVINPVRQGGTSGTSTTAPDAASARTKRIIAAWRRPGTVRPCSTIHPGAGPRPGGR